VSFLTPAFLLGALAIAIPIYIHLTNREKKEVVEFPSLMFLRRIPYRSVRRQRLRHLFLFALRCLALALIALAFARPFLESESTAAASPLGPREVVFVVDNSYSMGYEDRLSRAKAEVSALVWSLGTEDRGSVVSFSDRAEILVQSSSDPAELRAVVDGLRLSARTTRFGPGLKLAKKIVDESDLSRKEVVVVSDFQRIGFEGDDDDVWLPPEARLTPVDLSSEETENLAVTSAVLERDFQGGRERLTAAARVTYKGPFEAKGRSTRVQLELDGRSVQTKELELAPNSSETVAFDPIVLPQSLVRGSIRIDSDRLPEDDSYHFVLSPGQSLRVLILSSAMGSTRRNFFVERALGLGDRPSFQVESKILPQLRPADLAGVDVVFLNDAGTLGDGPAKLLEGYVERGGGLIVVLGEASSSSSFAGSAASILPAPLGSAIDRSRDWGGTLSYLDYGSPVFDVFGAPHSGDFSSAKFFRYRAFASPIAEGVLARFDDGAPALTERRVGEGRILVWTSTLDTFWNDLARQSVFLPFVHQLVKRASSYAEADTFQTVGEVADLDRYLAMVLDGDANVTAERGFDIVVSSPSSVKTIIPRSESRALLQLDEHGFYEVRQVGAAARSSAASLAVNLDTSESDLARLDPEELVASVTFRDSGTAVAAGGSGGETPDAQEGRQGYWWVLLAAAFLLFAIETLLSNRLSLGSRQRGYTGVNQLGRS
jgi:hypothetical protein